MHGSAWNRSAAYNDHNPKVTGQGTWTALLKAPFNLIPQMAQRPSKNSLETAPVFRLGEWGTEFWGWIQNVLDFFLGFFINLFSFCLSFVHLHWGKVVIALPLGFEAQLVPIVLDV